MLSLSRQRISFINDMRGTIKNLIVIASFFLCLNAYSGERYAVIDKSSYGLSNNQVRSIIQDSRGYVWIGTEIGLNRFDGTRVTVYKAKDYNLSSNYIFSLFEDLRGNIWAGTANGAFYYDYDTDSFVVPKEEDGSYPQDLVSGFACNSKGEVWFSPNSQGNIYSFDYSKGYLVRHCATLDAGPKYMSFTNDDKLVLIANYSMYTFNPGVNVLQKIYERQDRGNSLHPRLRGPVVNPTDSNVIFFATERSLSSINLSDSSVRELYVWEKNRVPVTMRVIGGGNRVAVSTSSGLLVYDMDTGKSATEIPDEFCIGCSQSPTGGIWLGLHDSGVRYYGPEMTRFKEITSFVGGHRMGEIEITSISQDEQGRIWATSNGFGLIYVDNEHNGFVRVQSPLLPSSLNAVSCHRGKLYLASENGLLEYVPVTGAVRKIYGSPILGIYKSEEAEPELYFCDRHHLFRLDAEGNGINSISGFELPQQAIQKSFVKDKNGNVWISTYVSGLFSFNESERLLSRFDVNEHGMISSVMSDFEGNVWTIGHDAELCRISSDNTLLECYDRERIPAFPDASFLNALPSGDGRMWISSTSGLIRFDPVSGDVDIFDRKNGLSCDSFARACCKLSSGDIVFATSAGLVMFSPSEMNGNIAKADIVSFRIGDSNKRYSENINNVKSLSIPLATNSFGFEFASPGAFPQGSIKCRLKNFENSWRQLGIKNDVYYYNIPSGKYVLEISGHDAVEIEIVPPFWSTPAGIAAIIFLALVSGLSIAFYFAKKKEMSQKAKERERMITEKLGFLSGFMALEQIDGNNPESAFMKKMDSVVTKHLSDENFGVEQLADEMSMSHRSLTRHTSAAFNTTPSDYIRTKRIAVASHLLSKGDLSVSDVAFRCGFSSPSYFAKCYKDVYGVQPSAAIQKK